jgi:hypothetical protein
MLTRLVYYSESALTSRGQALADELRLLRDTSIRNNSRDGLTGGLVFNGSHFIQVIEGDPGHVITVYSRIFADPRHREVAKIGLMPSSRRAFEDWPMGYADDPRRLDALWSRRGLGGAFHPSRLSAHELVDFVRILIAEAGPPARSDNRLLA